MKLLCINLLVVEENAAKSYTGQTVGGKTLTPQDVSNWRISFTEQKKYKSVIATWHDSSRARLIEEKASNGKPTYSLRTSYPNAQTAKAAASAKLQKLNQDSTTLNLILRGDPELTAESKLYLAGFRPNIPEAWVITHAEHLLYTSGYRTIIEATPYFERGKHAN